MNQAYLRPEHPNPMMERERWVNLNGEIARVTSWLAAAAAARVVTAFITITTHTHIINEVQSTLRKTRLSGPL